MEAPIAWITGSTRGIGRAIAVALADAGHAVLLTGRDLTQLSVTAGELRERSAAGVVAEPVDLRSPDAAGTLLTASRRGFGRGPDVLVNNAGTAPSNRFERTGDSVLDEVLDLHVKTPFRLIREVLPGMRDAGRGTIVQLASSAGLRGFPFTAAYTAAKHAMVGMTRALSAELGDGDVRAYAVCPGFVDTDITRQAASAVAARGRQSAQDALAAMAGMNRIGRMHTPDEVASAVVRICLERPDGCVLDLDCDPPAFVS